eukprot:jgi/Picre1/34815/NNA_002281.t1
MLPLIMPDLLYHPWFQVCSPELGLFSKLLNGILTGECRNLLKLQRTVLSERVRRWKGQQHRVCLSRCDTVSSHEQDTPEETPVEHGETTVPENFDISDSVQEKEKEDAAKDVDQLLEYLASNQLNLSGPASANLMSLLENSGYKTPETQTAEPSIVQGPMLCRLKGKRQRTPILVCWGNGRDGSASAGSSIYRTEGRETIKALQQYTGAMIQIDQSTDPTRVTIAGSRQSLQLAISMVSDIIKGRFKGFAMLRQIAISSDGMGLGHPVYVQGYGFMPPSQAMSATQSSGSVSPDVLPQRTVGMSAPLHRAPSPLNPGIVGLQDPQQAVMGNAYAGMPDLSSLSQFMNPPQYGTSAVQQQQQQFGSSASQDAMLARLIQLAALEQQNISRAPPGTSQRDIQASSSEFLGQQQQMPPLGGFVPQQQQPASSLGFYSDAFQGRMNEMDQRQASLFGSQTRSSDSSYFSGQQQ